MLEAAEIGALALTPTPGCRPVALGCPCVYEVPRVKLLLFAAAPDSAGLALGRFPAPAWAIWLVSAVVVLGSVLFLVIRARRSKARPGGRP
jgi:hypothetical protein